MLKLLIAALFVLSMGLLYRLTVGDGNIQETINLKAEANKISEEIVILRERNQALAAEVADLKNGFDAVEERARSELGMIREGETFYQFVGETKNNIPSSAGGE